MINKEREKTMLSTSLNLISVQPQPSKKHRSKSNSKYNRLIPKKPSSTYNRFNQSKELPVEHHQSKIDSSRAPTPWKLSSFITYPVRDMFSGGITQSEYDDWMSNLGNKEQVRHRQKKTIPFNSLDLSNIKLNSEFDMSNNLGINNDLRTNSAFRSDLKTASAFRNINNISRSFNTISRMSSNCMPNCSVDTLDVQKGFDSL